MKTTASFLNSGWGMNGVYRRVIASSSQQRPAPKRQGARRDNDSGSVSGEPGFVKREGRDYEEDWLRPARKRMRRKIWTPSARSPEMNSYGHLNDAHRAARNHHVFLLEDFGQTAPGT